MTKTAHADDTCEPRWQPGKGGLLALVRPNWVPAVDTSKLPPEAVAIPPDHLHLTLLRRASMDPLAAALGEDWETVRQRLPPIPRPHFVLPLHCARRPPHPEKDPPGETRPRTTWFLAVADQEAWRALLLRVVEVLDELHRERGGEAFQHPEPHRFFHLSLFNDRDGDPSRSIGGISETDAERA